MAAGSIKVTMKVSTILTKGWYSISDETFVPENQTEAAVIDGIQVTVY